MRTVHLRCAIVGFDVNPAVLKEAETMVHERPGAPCTDGGDGRLVLEGVPRVGFYAGGDQAPESYPFPSCLAAALRYIGEAYPWLPMKAHGVRWRLNWANIHILNSCGMAYGLLWRTGWHLDNPDLMFVADPGEVIRRAFEAVGYSYEIVEKTGAADDEARFRRKIAESLRRGRPVLAFGVVGPPECSLVTGYDESGDVLLGWNFFQDHPFFGAGATREDSGYFRKGRWFPETHTLILIGNKTAVPEPHQHLREVLRWALRIVRTPEVFGRHSGLAAYTAWATQLADDSAFAQDDAALRQRHDVHNAEVGTVAECRAWAGRFLKRMAEEEPAMAADLHAAADCYLAEHDLMWQVWDLAGGNGNPQAYQALARPAVRRQMVPIILRARELDEEAADHLERALTR